MITNVLPHFFYESQCSLFVSANDGNWNWNLQLFSTTENRAEGNWPTTIWKNSLNYKTLNFTAYFMWFSCLMTRFSSLCFAVEVKFADGEKEKI